MDIYKVFDLLERVERQVSQLYKKLHEDFKLNREVSSFFSLLHLEEEAHIQLIRMARRIVQSSPRAFSEVQVNLTEINSLLENIDRLKTAKLELPELLGRIYSLESSPAEKYLVDALKDTNEELRDFLIQMSETFNAHAEKVATFARGLGIEIEAVQDRYLRKARVGYAESVMLNDAIRSRGVDISEGGLFVLTGRTFHANDIVRLQFAVQQIPIQADAGVQFSIENVGMGLRFTAIKDEDRELIRQYVEQRIDEKGPEKHRRVLLVGSARQGGKDMRSYMHDLLAAGYKVVDVAGFEDSVSLLRKASDFSCIVLLIESETDVNYYLLHLLASMEHYRDVPLLVLTNNNEKAFRETMVKKGVSKMLVKLSTSPKKLTDEVSAATG